jgi:hypothetical protein
MCRLKIAKSLLLLAFVFSTASTACGPARQSDGGSGASNTRPNGLPELTKEIIDERINDARVFDVPPESGSGDPISWSFDFDEPKEIVVVDKQVDGSRATVILDIKTQSAPRARTQRHLSGQIRTDWKIETGWVLRRWEIVNTENISMKYRDVPKELPQNTNR